MLARMLRFTIALQMVAGALLGAWLASGCTSRTGFVLYTSLSALLVIVILATAAKAARASPLKPKVWIIDRSSESSLDVA